MQNQTILVRQPGQTDKVQPLFRGGDKWGAGHFGASRGDRKHNGIDLCCEPGSDVFPNVEGEITKLGYPYGDDLSFRYVEVTAADGLKHRFFYIEPAVAVGDKVDCSTAIGTSQKLGDRYPEISEHFHYEVKDGKSYLDPNQYV